MRLLQQQISSVVPTLLQSIPQCLARLQCLVPNAFPHSLSPLPPLRHHPPLHSLSFSLAAAETGLIGNDNPVLARGGASSPPDPSSPESSPPPPVPLVTDSMLEAEPSSLNPTPAETAPDDRRRCCSGCCDWYESSAGGKSGIVSVALSIIIAIYAAFIGVSPFVVDAISGAHTAETFLQMNPAVQVVVGVLCGLLIFLALWTVRRSTCARQSILSEIKATAHGRRASEWRAVRAFACVVLVIGPSSYHWAHLKLVGEIFDAAIQIRTAALFADQGYTPAALIIYFAAILHVPIVLAMLTLPRTIRVVRGVLMLNALVSAFYGLFPVLYFLADGLGARQKVISRSGGHSAFTEVELTDNELSSLVEGMIISSAREALFGGNTFGQVAWKIVSRLFPLFKSIIDMEDLVGLEFIMSQGLGGGSNTASTASTQPPSPTPSEQKGDVEVHVSERSPREQELEVGTTSPPTPSPVAANAQKRVLRRQRSLFSRNIRRVST